MDRQGLYLSIIISYRKFLGDESSKQVASILNDKDSECVKCFSNGECESVVSKHLLKLHNL